MELIKDTFSYVFEALSIPQMFLSFIAYIFLQIIAIKKAKGNWRFFSYAPAPIMILVFSYTIYALMQNSNLWPILLLFTSPVAFMYMVIFFIVFGIYNKSKAGGN